MATDSPTTHPTRSTRAADTVPWWTVLSLAAAMAYGDGFWMVALRDAFGAVERTDHPFTSWLVESTLALPVFALAVLEVITRAHRRYGPLLTAARPVARTGVATAFAGSIVGAVWLSATAAYDYRLQAALVQHMTAMRGNCVGNCVASEQNSTMRVHVEALLLGGALLVATNVVVVAWVIAVRGGRLRAAGAVGARRVSVRFPVVGQTGDSRTLVGVALVGSGADHLVPALAGGSATTVVQILAAVEILLGAVFLARRPDPGRFVEATAMLVSAVALSGWLIALATGQPVAGSLPGSGGVPYAAAGALDLGVLVGTVALLRGRGRPQRPRTGSAHDRALVLLTVVVLAAIGLTGTTPAWTIDVGAVDAGSHPAVDHQPSVEGDP